MREGLQQRATEQVSERERERERERESYLIPATRPQGPHGAWSMIALSFFESQLPSGQEESSQGEAQTKPETFFWG